MSKMWDFLKKRRETQRVAEQQRKINQVLDMQQQILALYERPEPLSHTDELARVKASFERGLIVIQRELR